MFMIALINCSLFRLFLFLKTDMISFVKDIIKPETAPVFTALLKFTLSNSACFSEALS